MSYPGLRSEEERAAVIAYLRACRLIGHADSDTGCKGRRLPVSAALFMSGPCKRGPVFRRLKDSPALI